jgi:hypothetical protein
VEDDCTKKVAQESEVHITDCLTEFSRVKSRVKNPQAVN